MREGLDYGGMPYDEILFRLEETDPDLVGQVRGYDEFHDVESDYDNYVRSEIVDWTPDAPYLESDQPRRDPAWSRSMLHLRYNGTRGSNPELPRHPELFYGFTGNDPRGADVDNPRFDQVRGHITARAAELTVRMGDNDDFHLAERPWTNQSISYARKEIHRRLKANTKIFTVQKEGRPWSRNYVADEFAASHLRAAGMDAGDESLTYRASDTVEPIAIPERFAAGDHGPADDLWTGGVRGVDAGHRLGAEVAPWRHTTGEADLGVQRYGQKRGAGRATLGGAAQGGGRLTTAGADQDWTESRRARSTNRQALGATMALAARHRRAIKSGAHDHDGVPGAGLEARAMAGGGLAPSRDVAAMHRLTVEDQARRPATEVQDGEGGALGPAAGLTPAAHPERAVRATRAHTSPNAHLTNVGSIVAGLREGTAAGRRRIAGLVVADGARPSGPGEEVSGARRGALPSTDYGRTAYLAEMPLSRAAAAEGLVVHAYGSAAPGRPEQRAALARGAYDAATWQRQHEALPQGRSQAPGQWKSATTGQTTVGDTPDRVFGYDAEVVGAHGAAPTGPKSLRAGGWSDSAGLSDSVGGFSDDIVSSA
jgi:hypothetical protein